VPRAFLYSGLSPDQIQTKSRPNPDQIQTKSGPLRAHFRIAYDAPASMPSFLFVWPLNVRVWLNSPNL